MVMAELVERYWTAEDVRALPEDGNRYECIDGVLLVTPSPAWTHAHAVRVLMRLLDGYVRQHGLGALATAPRDVELTTGDVVQPDILVARSTRGQVIREEEDVAGLVLVIEILSPSSASRDRGVKRKYYQRAGVEAYWVVDLDARVIERWTPTAENADVCSEKLVWMPRGASEASQQRRTCQRLAQDQGGDHGRKEWLDS